MTGAARKLNGYFWLGALALPFLLIAVLNAVLGRGPGIPAEYRYRSAQAVESAAATPAELPTQGWQPISLPGYIPDSELRPSSGWFRIELLLSQVPEEMWAVYFELPYSNLAVFVNGVAVGASGPMARPIPMFREPLLFTFPASLLRSGINHVDVRSLEADYLSRLDDAVIGPASQVEPAFRFKHHLDVTSKQVAVVVLVVLAALFTALWLLRRHETGYAWFALGLFAWAAHIQIGLIPRSPFPPEVLWTYLRSIAIGVFAIATALFTNRQAGLVQPRVEKAIGIFGIACAVFMIVDASLLGRSVPMFVPYVWMPGLSLVALYSLAQLLRANLRRPGLDVKILLAGAWMLMVISVHDLLIETGAIAWSPLYMNYTVGFVLCAVSAVLLHRFAQAFDAAERARDELDRRVREKSAELEQNLGRMKDLERERALNAERERILQDMHDGVGGHLVQALAIATSREQLRPLEEPLRACLEELRLMVDSLEPANGDLASVLGSLRPRISRRLALAGVEMRWQVDDLPPISDLGPRKVLDVARVVQEAITNSLKHSGCDQISVTARSQGDTGGIVIVIEDNGAGLKPPQGKGHGLASMRRRAAALGGTLELGDGASGTRVTLTLPAPAGSRIVQAGQPPDQVSAARAAAAHS